MRKTKYIFIIVLFAIFACEKVIEVDLNEVNPKVVIEGNLSNNPISAEVFLSKTGNYFGETVSEKVSGASVIVENNLGESYILYESTEGVYNSFEIIPEEGVLYSLRVESEGKIYEANSMLNKQVSLDSLSYFYDDGFAFMDEGYLIRAYFTDPLASSNYYRIRINANDTLRNENDDFIIFDDRLINGKQIEVTLRGNIFEIGDTVSIQLISLDENVYDYYNTFQELINVNPGSAAPANPTSNISNGALGYFSAWSSDIKTVIIEE